MNLVFHKSLLKWAHEIFDNLNSSLQKSISLVHYEFEKSENLIFSKELKKDTLAAILIDGTEQRLQILTRDHAKGYYDIITHVEGATSTNYTH
jgi:hypothetical protein